MRTFTLLDLADQAPFVPDAIREQEPPRILAWLRQFGEVEAYPICFYLAAGTSGAFRAPSGLLTLFLLMDSGTLLVARPDEPLHRVWPPPASA